MAKHPKGQTLPRCTFHAPYYRGGCPHYIYSHYGRACRGWEQGVTQLGTMTIYHCLHDPPKVYVPELPL